MISFLFSKELKMISIWIWIQNMKEYISTFDTNLFFQTCIAMTTVYLYFEYLEKKMSLEKMEEKFSFLQMEMEQKQDRISLHYKQQWEILNAEFQRKIQRMENHIREEENYPPIMDFFRENIVQFQYDLDVIKGKVMIIEKEIQKKKEEENEKNNAILEFNVYPHFHKIEKRLNEHQQNIQELTYRIHAMNIGLHLFENDLYVELIRDYYKARYGILNHSNEFENQIHCYSSIHFLYDEIERERRIMGQG